MYARDEISRNLINCQRYADLAGVRYDAASLPSTGRIRYCKTHRVRENLEALAQGGPCILITSSSDASVTDELVAVLPSNVIQWFSNNVTIYNPRVRALPLGIIQSRDYENALLAQIASGRTANKQLLYVNFTAKNSGYHDHIREDLLKRFSTELWATVQYKRTMSEFYADIACHDFVLSPPGAGPDCHRHWESMLLGSIPIVLRSAATRLLDDMPALQVASWDEVTKDLLEASRQYLIPRFESPAMRKLGMIYWKEKIQGCL